MTKTEWILRFLLTLMVILFVSLVYEYFQKHATDNAVSTPSYREQNMKVLRMAQRDDILICIVGSGTAQTVQRALLVENSNEDRVVAYSLNQRSVGGIRIYDYLMFDTCEIRILRPSETRGASDMLASIILYGFDPPPAK